MNCEAAIELLSGQVDERSDDRRAALEHASACRDCHDALTAVHALRLSSLAPVPGRRSGAVERVLAAAYNPANDSTSAGRLRAGTAGRFWFGASIGGAMAAAATFAAVTLWPGSPDPDRSASPRLQLAIDEPSAVSIALTTPDALIGAEVQITLVGAVSLEGYAGQRQLSWSADLDAGANRLTLPIVATGAEGGQVVVDVVHAGKRRTFLMDIEGRA